MLQSILIPISAYTERQAEKWIEEHGYLLEFAGKQERITPKYYRFRQIRPVKGMKYRLLNIPHTDGIKFVVGYYNE